MVPHPIAFGELAEKRNEKLEIACYQSQYLLRRVMKGVLTVRWFEVVPRRRWRELILKDHTPVVPYCVVLGVLFEEFGREM